MRQGFSGSSIRLIGVLAAATVLLLARAPIVQAVSEAEKSFLSLYFTEDELHVISATRSLQSIARVAENIEVVTAGDIELMNAHTLADVLNTVSGVKVNFSGSFGSVTMPYIQGSNFSQVTVLLDGVLLNNLTDNVVDVAFFPVTDIARVEIVKGPASSAWGSALGGVVNVVTRDPAPGPFQADASASYGAENSVDYRASVSGGVGGLGYYLSGTGLRTDGLTDGFDVDEQFFGAKLTYALSNRTAIAFNFSHGEGPRGDGNAPEFDIRFDRDTRQTVAKLSLRTAVGGGGSLEATLGSVWAEEHYFMRTLSTGEEQARSSYAWSRTGGGLSYARSVGGHDLVVGADYWTGEVESTDFPDRKPDQWQWAVFANDTVSFGAVSITPGLRYDDVSTSGGFVSPSLGATYALSRDVLVRATAARGFSLPSPIDTNEGTSEIMGYQGNPDLKPETVWSYQAGIEGNVLDALWLKAAFFRHDLDDAFVGIDLGDGLRTQENGGRQRRQGVEFGLRTVPFHHFTLAAGATFIEGEDLESGQDLTQIPKSQYTASVKYGDGRSFRALVTGNYRVETYEPAEVYNADINGFIVDLHLAKKFPLGPRSAVEAFASVHNLFNGDQYYADIYKNPGRWAEGGIRVSF